MDDLEDGLSGPIEALEGKVGIGEDAEGLSGPQDDIEQDLEGYDSPPGWRPQKGSPRHVIGEGSAISGTLITTFTGEEGVRLPTKPIHVPTPSSPSRNLGLSFALGLISSGLFQAMMSHQTVETSPSPIVYSNPGFPESPWVFCSSLPPMPKDDVGLTLWLQARGATGILKIDVGVQPPIEGVGEQPPNIQWHAPSDRPFPGWSSGGTLAGLSISQEDIRNALDRFPKGEWCVLGRR